MAILELSRQLETGSRSATDLARDALARAEGLDSRYNIFITICAERAMHMARAADERARAGARLGLLDGIPVTIKDLLDLRGTPTTNGSGAGWGGSEEQSADVVANLERAGAVVIGKTNLHELGMGITNDNPHFGKTFNPWNRDLSPGGSSGGSAAAVALGIGAGSVGTDTGGSIRIPAAHCGIFGLKPTLGALSTKGVSGIAWSLDHTGPLAATIDDLAILFQAMREGQVTSMDTRHRDLAGLRIGVPTTYFNERIEPAVEAAYRAALGALEGGGAMLCDFDPPDPTPAVSWAFILARAEAWHLHRKRYADHPDSVGEGVQGFLDSGRQTDAAEYLDARARQESFGQAMERSLLPYDVVVVPATPATAKPYSQEAVSFGDEEEMIFQCMIRYTSVFNISGHPVVVAPCPSLADGLPAGIQMVGPRGSEHRLLSIARAYEEVALADHLSRLRALIEQPVPPVG